MRKTLSSTGDGRFNFKFTDGQTLRVTEDGAKELAAMLGTLSDAAARAGATVVVTLSTAQSTRRLDVPVNVARRMVADIERGLAENELRRLSQGRPISKTDKVTRDANGEMASIETAFQY